MRRYKSFTSTSNFFSIVCSALNTQNKLFSNTFGCKIGTVADPRLLCFIYDFIPEESLFERDFNDYATIPSFRFIWKRLVSRNSFTRFYIKNTLIVLAHSPKMACEFLIELYESYGIRAFCVYETFRSVPNKRAALYFFNMIIKKYATEKMIMDKMDYIIQGIRIPEINFNPEIDLFVHKLIFGLFPIDIKNTNTMSICDGFIGRYWKDFVVIPKQINNPTNLDLSKLQELTELFKLQPGATLIYLADGLFESGSEELAEFWVNKKVTSILHDFRFGQPNYTDKFWLLIKKLLFEEK